MQWRRCTEGGATSSNEVTVLFIYNYLEHNTTLSNNRAPSFQSHYDVHQLPVAFRHISRDIVDVDFEHIALGPR